MFTCDWKHIEENAQHQIKTVDMKLQQNNIKIKHLV